MSLPASAPQPAEAPRLDREARVDLAWSLFVVLAMGAAFALLELIPGVAVPVLAALGLAYAFDPLVDRFEDRGWSRSAAIALLFGLATLVIAGLLAWLVPAVVEQATRLPDYLVKASGRLLPLAEELTGQTLPRSMHEIAAQAGEQIAGIASKVAPAAGGILLRAATSTASAISFAVSFFLIPVFLFYFLRDFDRLKASAARLLPPRDRRQVGARFSEIDVVCAAFVRGQATVAAILGMVYAVGLTLAGVKLGLLIGLLAGVASLVPFAGPAVGLVLSGVAVVVDWHEGSIWVALFAAITFVVGQVLEGYVITPKVVGDKVGLSPVAVMLAVLAFGELLGFAGLLLAVPLAAVLKVVGRVLVRHYRRSSFFVSR